MSGITRLTALEIFTNPDDLEIVIGKVKNSDKYIIAIMRGPGHNFKMMIDSEPFAGKFEDAIESIKTVLEAVRESITKELGDPETLASQILNPDGQAVDQSKVLSSDLIDKIIDELRQHKVASTYKMKVAS